MTTPSELPATAPGRPSSEHQVVHTPGGARLTGTSIPFYSTEEMRDFVANTPGLSEEVRRVVSFHADRIDGEHTAAVMDGVGVMAEHLVSRIDSVVPDTADLIVELDEADEALRSGHITDRQHADKLAKVERQINLMRERLDHLPQSIDQLKQQIDNPVDYRRQLLTRYPSLKTSKGPLFSIG